jgi:hypothetical protein
VQQWIKQCNDPVKPRWQEYEQDIANLAAQWGADQELEACCEWLWRDLDAYELVASRAVYLDHNLRAARRPKLPSLKEQALEDLARIEATYGHLTWPETQLQSKRAATIRRALEALDD